MAVFLHLGHEKFIAIITHGGWSSVLESLIYSRPMILMPLFGDHFKNAQVIRQKQIGVIIDKNGMDKKVLHQAIIEILQNTK